MYSSIKFTHVAVIIVENLIKLSSRKSLNEDEEMHLSNLLMVEVPLELDQEEFTVVVGKDGLEQGDEDHQQVDAVALEGQVKESQV